MFFPVQMNRAVIGIHRSRFESSMAALHEEGIVEISDIRDNRSKAGELTRNSPNQEDFDRVISTQISIGQIRDRLLSFAQKKRVSLLSGSLLLSMTGTVPAPVMLHSSAQRQKSTSNLQKRSLHSTQNMSR